MKFTDINESLANVTDKQHRLNQLFNQRAELRDTLNQARLNGAADVAVTLNRKLARLNETIELLQESASGLVAAKARLAKLKSELEELPQNPQTQAGYDAIDELRDKVRAAQREVDSLTETAAQPPSIATDSTMAFEHHLQTATELLQVIQQQLTQFASAQRRNARDWGYAGTMQQVVARLKEVHEYFGN